MHGNRTPPMPTARTMDDMPDLATALADHLEPDPRPEPSPGDRLAAVLALIVADDRPRLVLTERSGLLSRHAGEVSFPGGLAENGDADLAATALRETEEELGIWPSAITVVGALAPIHTHVSATLVVPFVGMLAELPPLVTNAHEIAAVHVPVLADLSAVEEQRVVHGEDGVTWRGWWYELPAATVWGATGSMLHALLQLVRKEAPWALR